MDNATALSGALSFVGGGAFRMVWGEFSAFMTRWQEHRHEIARMAQQNELDDSRHKRDLEHIRLAKELGVTEVPFQTSEGVDLTEWFGAQKRNEEPTGYAWLDVWNKGIRPAGATLVLAMWLVILMNAGFKPSAWDLDVMGAILGFFYADRTLGKRGR
jgi:hypothetical protein